MYPDQKETSKNWEPAFGETLKDPGNLDKIISMMKNGELRSTESNPLALLGWRMNKGVKVLSETCLVCDTNVDVEMHHVKSLGSLAKKIKQ